MAKFKFRLVFGSHMEEEAVPGTKVTRTMHYRPGEVIDTDTDLAEKFNSPDPFHGKKFERVDYEDYKAKEALVWMKEHQPEAYEEYMKHMSSFKATKEEANHRAPADSHRNDSLVEDLKGYTLRELQAHAEAEEIDLEGATRKEDVLAKILEHVAATQLA